MSLASDFKSAIGAELIFRRTIVAPRAKVFEAWTDPKQMARWWGPKDFTNPVCDLDVRPGGLIRIDMRAPDGVVYPMDGVFLEVVPPERLVFTGRAFDRDTNKTLLEDHNTVTFAEEGGKTKLTVVTRILALAPEFAAAAAGMEQGWQQSFDRLQALLAKEM
jgi:uncharacterized protein YndB with AHSA1/START domain